MKEQKSVGEKESWRKGALELRSIGARERWNKRALEQRTNGANVRWSNAALEQLEQTCVGAKLRSRKGALKQKSI